MKTQTPNLSAHHHWKKFHFSSPEISEPPQRTTYIYCNRAIYIYIYISELVRWSLVKKNETSKVKINNFAHINNKINTTTIVKAEVLKLAWFLTCTYVNKCLDHTHTFPHTNSHSQLAEAHWAPFSHSDSQLSVSLPSEPRFLIRELAAVSSAKIHTVIHLTLSTLWLMPH